MFISIRKRLQAWQVFSRVGTRELLSVLLWRFYQGKGGEGDVEGKLDLIPTTKAFGCCWDALFEVYGLLGAVTERSY